MLDRIGLSDATARPGQHLGQATAPNGVLRGGCRAQDEYGTDKSGDQGREHDPNPDEPFDVRLRSGDTPDVRLVVDTDSARLELSDKADGPTVELDPAARTLVLWGRRPDHRGRFTSNVDRPTLARLQTLLAGD